MSETVKVDVGGLYVDAVLIGWAELDDLAQVRFEDGDTKTVMKSQVDRPQTAPDPDRLTRLDELEALEPGWLDGEGAAIDAAALEAARALLDALAEFYVSPPLIYPTPEGWVQFEWDKPNVQVEVTLTGHNHEIFVLYADGHRDTINKPDARAVARAVAGWLDA